MDPVVVSGGAVGIALLTLAGTLIRLMMQDSTWRELYRERSDHYADCKVELAKKEAELQNLRGEVISLRGMVHDRRFNATAESEAVRFSGGMSVISEDDDS